MPRLDLPDDPLIWALLRVPAQAIHRRIIAGLHRAGFRDLRLPHMGVLQYPGPDGLQPSVLAVRAGMSKQGYESAVSELGATRLPSRRKSKEDQRARVVYFTARGRAAWNKIHEILAAIEADWQTTLGEEDFRHLKALLRKVRTSGLVP